MTLTPGADIPVTERDVAFVIADLAGFTALTEIHGSRYAAWVVTHRGDAGFSSRTHTRGCPW